MSLADALSSADAAMVSQICEKAELEAAENGRAHPHAMEHLLALLLQDDLCEARFLWRRLSEEVRLTTQPAWMLAQALWRNDRPGFYQCATYSWPESARPIVSALLTRMRARSIQLITSAYTSVTAQALARLLGVNMTDLDDICNQHQWKRDGDFIVISQNSAAVAADITSNVAADIVSHPLSTPASRDSEMLSHSRQSFSELQTLTEQLVRLQTT